MLDDADRRFLAETERRFAEEDPALVRALESGRPRSSRTLEILVVLIGTALVLGLAWLDLWGHALLIALLATAVVLWCRGGRGRTRR